MIGHVVAYDLVWYGTFPHEGMSTFFVLSTQGKSGILSGKGEQGRARSNLAPEYPPGQQSRRRERVEYTKREVKVDGTLIQTKGRVRCGTKKPISLKGS